MFVKKESFLDWTVGQRENSDNKQVWQWLAVIYQNVFYL